MKQTLHRFCIALALLALPAVTSAQAGSRSATRYEYKQISTIESVVPGGLGRSRVLTTDENGQLLEKELKNFYSFVGINFENISNNDRIIVERLNELAAQGWDLFQVTSGSNQQQAGGSSGTGIFITRYLFRREH